MRQAGRVTRNRTRVGALACAIFAVTLVPALAQAAPPPLLTQFCKGAEEEGIRAGQCNVPRGIAVNQANGHAYLADQGNQRIQEFSPWGAFVRTWGGGVVNGGAAGTGILTPGSAVVTAVQTTEKAFAAKDRFEGSIASGQAITGTGIAPGTTIAAIGAATITLSKPASAAATGTPTALSVAAGTGNVALNERQTISVAATGGTFNLTFETPNPSPTSATTSANLPFNASAAEMQSALESLPNIGAGNVAVSGPNGGPYSVEFQGTRFADTDVSQLQVAPGSPPLSGGGASVETAVEGASAFEICNVAADCRNGFKGDGAGQLQSPQGVAVDSAGGVYVFDLYNIRMQKFDSAGHFLWTVGGKVNKTKEEAAAPAAQQNRCPVDPGDVCQGGVAGTGNSQFAQRLFDSELGSFIATDPGPPETIYVGDAGRIQKFAPDGTYQGELTAGLAGETVQALAVDPDGDLYASLADPKPYGGQLCCSKEDVRKLSPAGAPLGTLKVKNPRAIATDSDANVYVIHTGRPGEAVGVKSEVLQFTAAGKPVDFATGQPGFGRDVFDASTGIAASSGCGVEGADLFVVNSNYKNSFINLYGQQPDPAICPPPPVAPSINSQFATATDTTGATLKAKINPHFWADTRYYVQYGTGKCSEGGCDKSQPLAPGSLLTKDVLDGEVTSADVFITGLVPDTTYHYRFVAVSGGGGPVFGVDGKENAFHTLPLSTVGDTACPNQSFRAGPSAKLPDCRAYELVSPLDKNNGDIGSGRDSFAQAASDGNGMTFSSRRAFAGSQSAPLIGQYMAKRQAGVGWTTASIASPRSSISFHETGSGASLFEFKSFSDDLCSGWVLHDSDVALVPGAPANVDNLYRRDLCGAGAYELLTNTPPPGFNFELRNTLYLPELQGASADGGQSFFRAAAALAVADGGPQPPLVCSGKPEDGQPQAETIAFQWLRNGAPIPAATQNTYTPTAADQGNSLQCEVKAESTEGASLSASEVSIVAPRPAGDPPDPGNLAQGGVPLPGLPTLTGTPTVGETLTCTPGTWTGSPTFTYQWYRGGSEIPTATANTYVLQAADKATALQCRTTATNPSGAALTYSLPKAIAATPPRASAAPTVSGNGEVGQILTCAPGSWSASPTFAYQWLRNGTAIPGAATPTRTLGALDSAKAIQCRVTATSSEGVTQATSGAVVVSPPPATAPPAQSAAGAVTGTAAVGEILACNPGSWSGNPTFTFKWLRNGVEIPGVDENEYFLEAADKGTTLQCRAIATNGGGVVVAIDGSPTGARYVSPAPPVARADGLGNYQVYVAAGGQLRLVSVLPDGSPAFAESSVGTQQNFLPGNFRESSLHRAVSADGSRVVWTARPAEGPGGMRGGAIGAGPGQLFMRLNATEPQSAIVGGQCTEATKACTIPISAAPDSYFIGADSGGTSVIYAVGDIGVGKEFKLFEATVAEAGGQQVATSQPIAGGVSGVMGMSEDARRIYLTSTEVLSGAQQNSEGDVAKAGKANLYLYEQGEGFTFVAALSEEDVLNSSRESSAPPSPIAVAPNRRTSRVSPDGLHAAFTATATPTGYDNTDTQSGQADGEVYLFDATAGSAGELVCASCNPSGARPSGGRQVGTLNNNQTQIWAAAQVPGWTSETRPSRLLSEDGQRLFFNAFDSLVPGDSNGKMDVYQWQAPGKGTCTEAVPSFSEDNGGCIDLISSGESPEDSEVFDATANGSDVFFATQSSLLKQDPGLTDVYDARVDGGLPGPANPPPGCEGEACQGPLSAPNDPTPASSAFNGPGNVKEGGATKPRCAKGKAREKGRCVKSKAKKQSKSHQRKANTKRRASR